MKFVETDNLFKIFNPDGTIRDSRVTEDDLVIVPRLVITGDFKGNPVKDKSILITRGNAYLLTDLSKLDELSDLIYAAL